MPRVTVIVAARDAAATLPSDAVRRFARRPSPTGRSSSPTTPPTDATAASAADDPRVRVVATGGPLGPAGARNLAVAQADGELVATLDSDDLWEPDFLATPGRGVRPRDGARAPVGLVACDARLLGPLAWPATPTTTASAVDR